CAAAALAAWIKPRRVKLRFVMSRSPVILITPFHHTTGTETGPAGTASGFLSITQPVWPKADAAESTPRAVGWFGLLSLRLLFESHCGVGTGVAHGDAGDGASRQGVGGSGDGRTHAYACAAGPCGSVGGAVPGIRRPPGYGTGDRSSDSAAGD